MSGPRGPPRADRARPAPRPASAATRRRATASPRWPRSSRARARSWWRGRPRASSGLGVGDRLAVRAAGIRRELTVAGLLDPGDDASARALDGLLVTDISSAQEIFGAAGRLGRVDLIVADDEAGRDAPRPHRAGPAARGGAGRRGRAGGHHRADDPRLPVEPDRAVAPRPGRRHVPHLPDDDLLGGAAAPADRRPPRARGDARGDLRAGDGRGRADRGGGDRGGPGAGRGPRPRAARRW